MKKKLIVANWKMNKSWKEAEEFLDSFIDLTKFSTLPNVLYAICPSTLHLQTAASKYKLINFLGQDAHYEKNGAFTSSVSYEQLADVNAKGSLIGHYETRKYLNETDERINLKLTSLLNNKMLAVLCVGESLDQYEKQMSFKTVINQLETALKNISEKDLTHLIIAYEPIWAIGTGKVPTPNEVNELFKKIKSFLLQKYQPETVSKIKFLYGGSVNDQNAESFLKQKWIDGLLVGNFALNVNNFVKLLEIANNVNEQ